jgi:sulfatase modifying factor 1
VNRVGSESPKGDGLYGQADLAGNVWEWVQDGDIYANPCINCSYLTPSTRVLVGGGFNVNASVLSNRYSTPPSVHWYTFGGRCARTR